MAYAEEQKHEGYISAPFYNNETQQEDAMNGGANGNGGYSGISATG